MPEREQRGDSDDGDEDLAQDRAPTNEAIREMDGRCGGGAAGAANPRVAEQACERLRELCPNERTRQAAMDAGALEAALAVMRAHPQVAGVQKEACLFLHMLCLAGAGRDHRCQRAAELGALEASVAAMRAHPQVGRADGILLVVARSLSHATPGFARKQRAADAGLLEATVTAMRAFARVLLAKEWHECAAERVRRPRRPSGRAAAARVGCRREGGRGARRRRLPKRGRDSEHPRSARLALIRTHQKNVRHE